MTGCTVAARLYPVQGPLSTQTPLPVFSGEISGVVNSGNLHFVLSDGEVCRGPWTRVVTGSAPADPAWDAVYGSGYYVAHVLGASYRGEAAITGNRGTVLNVDFYRVVGNGNRIRFFGVAKDSKGNIYKIAFPRYD
jgi:hypothetical protein